ncbi:MAG: hypothetical protein ACRD2X_17995 [Vicinamibacteraceae bacterium]
MVRLGCFVILSLALALTSGRPGAQSAQRARPIQQDPFWLFEPAVELSAQERQNIARGEPIVKTLDADGQQLTVFAGGSLETTPEAFIANVRKVVALRKGRYVSASGRFASLPQVSDLSALTLGDSDLEDIEACRPRDCGLKLGAEEMVRLQRAAATSDTKQAVRREFRRIVLNRVKAYLADGYAGLPPYEDKEKPVQPASVASLLLERSSLSRHAPAFADYLAGAPRTKPDDVESFLYWSKEDFGQKPVITVSHVNILRGAGRAGLPAVIVASEQIFASHYMDGALTVATLEYDTASHPSARLGYVYRSSIDVLDGLLRRPIVEGRIEDEGKRLFVEQLKRLEQ